MWRLMILESSANKLSEYTFAQQNKVVGTAYLKNLVLNDKGYT